MTIYKFIIRYGKNSFEHYTRSKLFDPVIFGTVSKYQSIYAIQNKEYIVDLNQNKVSNNSIFTSCYLGHIKEMILEDELKVKEMDKKDLEFVLLNLVEEYWRLSRVNDVYTTISQNSEFQKTVSKDKGIQQVFGMTKFMSADNFVDQDKITYRIPVTGVYKIFFDNLATVHKKRYQIVNGIGLFMLGGIFGMCKTKKE